MIHCLKTWGHYIGSKDVVVWTNNVTLKYFTIQPKLSSKQVRWQDIGLIQCGHSTQARKGKHGA
jgi:hypothetical protein